MDIVYLDHAATTPVVDVAKKAFNEYMDLFYNPSAAYGAAREVREAVDNAREDIAKCIGALPEEIYFTSGATEGNNIAVQGGMKVCKGRFITTNIEHHSILNQVALYPENSYVVSVGYDGAIDMQDFCTALDFNDFVSVMLVNNEIGYINPLRDISKKVKKHKGIMHTDATQAVGHIKVDVRDLGVNILTASGHKFGAPKGVGFIYVNKGTHIPSLTYGGGQEKGLRSGTENVAGIVSMAEALKYATSNLKENNKYITNLYNYLIEKLDCSLINYSLNFTHENHYVGNVNLCLMGTRSEEVVEFLSVNGIYVSSGSACNTNDGKPSHVLTNIGLTEEQAESSIRISLNYTNTKEDIDRLLNTLNMYYDLRSDED